MPRSDFRILGPLLVMAIVAGCRSPDTDAAASAADAETALRQGRYADATRSINKAITSRDDISEYWAVRGRIDLATSNMADALLSYTNAISLDRSNAEYLRILCKLSILVGNAKKTSEYSDQLMLIEPTDPFSLAMKGNAALLRHDDGTADTIADQILAKSPDDREALLLKARVLAEHGEFDRAAHFIEQSQRGATASSEMIKYETELYEKAGNIERYQAAVASLARASPNDATAQIAYADQLFQVNDRDRANAVLATVMRKNPANLGYASIILEMWLRQGADALPADQIVNQSRSVSLEMKAAYAQFANETGHPEIALEVLSQQVDERAISAATADALTARAYAMALQGHRADALASLDAVLQFDLSQPHALLARSRIEFANGNIPSAIEDVRSAVAQDPLSATARLALFEMLLGSGNAVLAESALRDAIHDIPADPRLPLRLAQWLTQHGKSGAAQDALRAAVRSAPVNARMQRLAQTST